MIEQSTRMREVRLSRIREIMNYCAELRKQGRVILDFTNGEPDFVTPAYIRNALWDALEEGKTGYAPTSGVEALRCAVSEKLLRENRCSYRPEEVLITNGGTQSTYLAMTAFLNPGDEIILPDPGYTIYPEIAKMAGAVVRFYKLKRENKFQIDIQELSAMLNEKTKMILLVSPSNPIGSVLYRETLEQVADLVRGKDIIVLSDEVYERLLYGDHKHVSIAELEGMREQTIILNAFSKTYAMTGWRLGYVAAPEALIEPMMRLNSITTCGANNFVQWAGAAALQQEDGECEEMRKSYEKRIDTVVSKVRAMKHLSCEKPEGAFYVFINVSETGMSSEEFVKYIIDEASVALVPGSAFGSEGDGYVRFCCAKPMEEIEIAMERIAAAVEKIDSVEN